MLKLSLKEGEYVNIGETSEWSMPEEAERTDGS